MDVEKRKRTGHPGWKPGQSGNPSGRPKIVTAIRERAQKSLPEGVDFLERTFKDEGEPIPARITALKELVAMAIGRAPAEDYVFIPEFEGSLSERGERVLMAVAAGEIPLTVGERMMGLIQGQAKVVEITELSDVLAQYEKEFHSNAPRPILQPHVLPQAQN